MHASAFLVSPGGQSVAGIGPDQLGYLYPAAGGDGRPIRGMEVGEQPIAWAQNGLSLSRDVEDFPQCWRLFNELWWQQNAGSRTP